MKSELSWLFDIIFLRIFHGPYKQTEYHYHMLNKWGSRYNAYYIKHMIDHQTGQYKEP